MCNVVSLFVVNAEYNDYTDKNGVVVHGQRVRALVGNSLVEFACVTCDKFDFVSACKAQQNYLFNFDLFYELHDLVSKSGKAYKKTTPTFRLVNLVDSDAYVTVP